MYLYYVQCAVRNRPLNYYIENARNRSFDKNGANHTPGIYISPKFRRYSETQGIRLLINTVVYILFCRVYICTYCSHDSTFRSLSYTIIIVPFVRRILYRLLNIFIRIFFFFFNTAYTSNVMLFVVINRVVRFVVRRLDNKYYQVFIVLGVD